MSRDFIRERYGTLEGFRDAPAENPVSRGMAAGKVTDDTDQTVILARLLIEGSGTVDPHDFVHALLAWERRMEAAGSADLLGPSTRHALARVSAGASTDQSGRSGTTNGAAMRIAPVGIAFPADPLAQLVEAVAQASHVTHNTTIAIAGAAAVAAAVSAGVGGARVADALALSVEAAGLGVRHGQYVAGGDVAARIAWALELVRGRAPDEAIDLIYRLVGTGIATQEAVPAAMAVCAIAPDDPWRVCRLAASLGGDCDTIAAMVGAIMGACHGVEGFPSEAVAQLHEANPDLQLETLANDLIALRPSTKPHRAIGSD